MSCICRFARSASFRRRWCYGEFFLFSTRTVYGSAILYSVFRSYVLPYCLSVATVFSTLLFLSPLFLSLVACWSGRCTPKPNKVQVMQFSSWATNIFPVKHCLRSQKGICGIFQVNVLYQCDVSIQVRLWEYETGKLLDTYDTADKVRRILLLPCFSDVPTG